MAHYKRTQGLTLVEVLVLIAIIAILAAMAAGFLKKTHQGVPVKVTPPVATQVSMPASNYDVQFLFTISGMKVYRFSDNGHYVYIVDGRNSKASYTDTISTGKSSVSVPVEAQTP